MAKYEAVLKGPIYTIDADVERTVMGGISATLEEKSMFFIGENRCIIKAYERYSFIGENRVSLTITYIQNGEEVYVTAITTGGSKAKLVKINTFGEQAFLDKIIPVLNKYRTFKA